MPVTLEINTPEKTFPPFKADKIVLPVYNGNLTVIVGRAPRSELLTSGTVALLDVTNRPFKTWHIDGGLAEIATDVCKIAVERITEQTK